MKPCEKIRAQVRFESIKIFFFWVKRIVLMSILQPNIIIKKLNL